MSFKQIQERNSELAANHSLLAKLAGETEVKTGRRMALEQAIENITSNVAEFADDLLAGGEGADPIAVDALRTELDQVNFYIRALDVAIPKLRSKIQSQISDLAVEYAKAHTTEQSARAQRTLSALLDLAEVAAEEHSMRASAEAEGCAEHYFQNVSFVIHGGPLTGSFHTEKQHLAALFEKYAVMGFAPNAAQTKRLAALPD